MAENKEQFKNYSVGEIIGRGRFAIVYRAEKLDVRKTVALKVLNPEYANRTDIREQFREQAKQQAKLTHPRLVRVEDLREEHGQFFVAMEYMPQGSLRSWVTQNGMLSFRQAAIILEDAAEALDYLHGRKLVHGDVKPGNILLIDDPNQKNVLRAKLSDLKLPLTAEVSQTVSDNLIELTPEYISPEQASGTQTTPLSDQYSLGVVAYEMLCGQPPFTNKSQVDLYIDHQKVRPTPLQQLNDQVTSELEQVVLRALEKSPDNRFTSCSEFAKAFRAAVAATEQKRLTGLLDNAWHLLDKQEFDQARLVLKDALLIQPENEKVNQLLARLDQQEGLSTNYKQAVDALLLAESKAQAIRKTASNMLDEAGLLKTFAPPPPPFWKKLAEQWRSAGQFASVGLILILICLIGGTTWIDTAGSQSIKPIIVAINRTSTLTFTPTLTPTSTSTVTPTLTSTPTPTLTTTPTFTPTQIGGGSGKIAFHSYRDGKDEIYIINADGTGETKLTNNPKHDYYSSPTWSPDGKKLAFVSEHSANLEIYTMNVDGSELTNLTQRNGPDYSPAWSPDGSRIAFVYGDFNRNIYLMNADGSNLINLTPYLNADYPSWSPDGKKIAFVAHNNNYSSQVYVMNADGSNPIQLSKSGGADPKWSPDGVEIAFTDYNSLINVIKADGADQTRLSDNNGYDFNPIWSPDGKKIAFFSDRNGSTRIYVMNVDGTGQMSISGDQVVVNNSYLRSLYNWSPDSKKIVFVSFINGNPQIYIVNADGTNLTRLTNNDSYDYEPVWSP